MQEGLEGYLTLRRAFSSSGERTSAVKSASCAFSFVLYSCMHVVMMFTCMCTVPDNVIHRLCTNSRVHA